MAKGVDIETILLRNPQVDPVALRESRNLLRLLRELGTERKQYELSPSVARPVVRPSDGTGWSGRRPVRATSPAETAPVAGTGSLTD